MWVFFFCAFFVWSACWLTLHMCIVILTWVWMCVLASLHPKSPSSPRGHLICIFTDLLKSRSETSPECVLGSQRAECRCPVGSGYTWNISPEHVDVLSGLPSFSSHALIHALPASKFCSPHLPSAHIWSFWAVLVHKQKVKFKVKPECVEALALCECCPRQIMFFFLVDRFVC